jgi:hypothetical protein|nr:MAG TPA: hypothetical protein [Bacteriophage sp.]
MKKKVSGIELLQLIQDKKIKAGKTIYSTRFNMEFYWSGKNLESNDLAYLVTNNDIDFIEDTFIVNIELSADELFEELGFVKTAEDNDLIEYDSDYSSINFNKKYKTFKKEGSDLWISLEENKAINRKMEELGWLE